MTHYNHYNLNLISTVLDYLDLNKVYEFSQRNSFLSKLYIERKYKKAYNLMKAKSLKFEFEIGKIEIKDFCFNDKICLLRIYGGINFCLWADQFHSLIVYNLDQFIIQFRIDNAHHDRIYSIKEYFDEFTKITFCITSSADSTIKIWTIDQFNISLCNRIDCLTNNKCLLYNHCVLSHLFKNVRTNVLLASSYLNSKIKIFNFEGKHIGDIDNNDNVAFLNIWNDRSKNNTYVIVCGWKTLKSYTFIKDKLRLYKTYSKGPASFHNYAFVNNTGILIENDDNNTIRTWNFHSNQLIQTFKVYGLNRICSWNEDILIINIYNEICVQSLGLKRESYLISKEKENIVFMRKCCLNRLGTCLIIIENSGTIKLFN